DATITPGQGRFGAAPCSPMPSRSSSEYGPRDLFGHSFHSGIDLPVPTGTRLNALGDGVVTAVGYEAGGGHFIKIRYDNGVESFYCHLKSQSVRQGQRVSMGQEVARSDNTGQWTTGAHLHMGIKVNGQYVNPRSVRGIPLP
ncbi:MAG TPA: M23 family metallopeptidase, partial [Candidatus Ozemobacteraceae bacterium]|nr:M23 family metallopeptidase [Candidatus Ozemobacteraceae bacterium]